MERTATHPSFSSFGFVLSNKPGLLCLLLRSDSQLFHLFGIRGGSSFLSESGLDGCVGLFAQFLCLCEHIAFVRLLMSIAFLLRFDLCDRQDPSR